MKEIVSESFASPQIKVDDPQWYRACTLGERLASLQAQPVSRVGEQTIDQELAHKRLQRWQEQPAFQKGVDFAQRLNADHLSMDEFLTILGEPCEAIQQRVGVPGWMEDLATIFAGSDVPQFDETTTDDTKKLARLALIHIFDIFLLYGKNYLTRSVGDFARIYEHLPFDPANVASLLMPNLYSALSFTQRTLALELNVARLQERLHGESPEERFQDFIRQTREKPGLLALLEEYPVLARLIISALQRWLTSSLEFLSRLCADWPRICTTFFTGDDPGSLITAEGGAGDTHRGGRSVFKLTFASGRHLMYKPKSLAVDVHFQELLAWLNEQGCEPTFRLMTVLDCGDYGWCEYIKSQECTTQAEVERFYERQGAYLALLYALNATDFHYENLIASGEHPILVDLEALFHPHLSNEFTMQNDVATNFLDRSVMRVGLLPNRLFANNAQRGLDISGLGGRAGQQTPMPVLHWSEEGTDQMRMQRDFQPLPGKSNRPRLGDDEADPLTYRDQITAGFSRMYRLLMTQRDALIAGPLTRFEQDEIRCILRATNFYGHLLMESYHPSLLTDALNRDRHFDHLWLSTIQNPQLLRLIAAERQDLLASDIPMFTTSPSSHDLFSSRQEQIADFFSTTSLEDTQRTLLSLSEADFERQSWFVHASFTSMLMGQGVPSWPRPTVTIPSGKEITQERLIQAARAVGDRLCELALGDEQGVNWVGLTLVDERQWMLSATQPDLYNGNAGIMLFLSYLGAITGETRYSDMVEAAYITMHKQILLRKDLLKAVGAYDGWGSVIYLFSHLGTLWNDPTILAEAEEAVKLLPGIIVEDRMFDVLSGSAGCILSLASLYQVTPSPEVLSTAIQCGEHLLAHAQKQATGIGWLNTSMSDAPLAGFSHGTAGCALSLLVLAEMSGEERFRQAALEALAYERSLFSSQEQNWPDLRKWDGMDNKIKDVVQKPAGETFMLTWCHGAPGIGMSRLAALRYLDDEVIREEIAVAMRETIAHGFGQNHSLCHGDLGNLEILLTATQVLPEEASYREHLRAFTGRVLDSIDTDGWLTGIPLGVESPGLMTGLAGIGYGLLRLAAPDRVPAVLLLAPPPIKNL